MFTPAQTRVIGAGLTATVNRVNDYEAPTLQSLKDAIGNRILTAKQQNGVMRGSCFMDIQTVMTYIEMTESIMQAQQRMIEDLQDAQTVNIESDFVNIYEDEMDDLTALLQERNERIKELEDQLEAPTLIKSPLTTAKWLTVAEYAKEYSRAASTVYGYVKSGRVISQQTCEGGSIRILDAPTAVNPGKGKRK